MAVAPYRTESRRADGRWVTPRSSSGSTKARSARCEPGAVTIASPRRRSSGSSPRRANSPAPVGRSAPSPGVLVALSGRNQLRGIVDEIRVDGLLAQVRLRIGDQQLTAVITRDAVDALKLKRGHPAIAVIKATEVMIAREPAAGAATCSRLGRSASLEVHDVERSPPRASPSPRPSWPPGGCVRARRTDLD